METGRLSSFLRVTQWGVGRARLPMDPWRQACACLSVQYCVLVESSPSTSNPFTFCCWLILSSFTGLRHWHGPNSNLHHLSPREIDIRLHFLKPKKWENPNARSKQWRWVSIFQNWACEALLVPSTVFPVALTQGRHDYLKVYFA